MPLASTQICILCITNGANREVEDLCDQKRTPVSSVPAEPVVNGQARPRCEREAIQLTKLTVNPTGF
jgi:hypothetical protein